MIIIPTQIKYEITDDGRRLTLIPPCVYYIGCMVGSAHCVCNCSNLVKHDAENQIVYCKGIRIR